MKVKLYDDFNLWQDIGVIWLYSDPHFNDPESKLMNPNWPDADTIVKNINSKVGKYDTLIILGDVGDANYVPKLKGLYKVLITGNHDKGVSNYIRKEDFVEMTKEEIAEYRKDKKAFCKKARAEKNFKNVIDPEGRDDSLSILGHMKYYDNQMFDWVFDGPVFISSKILLSHEPIDIPFGINIHGHSHMTENGFYNEDTNAGVNICSDMTNFEPVRLDEILSKYKTKTIHDLAIEKAREGLNNK